MGYCTQDSPVLTKTTVLVYHRFDYFKHTTLLVIGLFNNQVFHILNIKTKQMIEESFPTLKINQHFNFHLEVINTV